MTAQQLPHLAVIDRTELSPEHSDVIRATLPLVGSKIDEITPLFYSKMFAKHPELIADTFNRGNQKLGAQQRALAASIATFASMLVNPDAPDPRDLLERIGHKHASLGITEDQYQIVHDNLFEAIVEVLGEDTVTPEVAEAWDAVYWIMARVLIDFEKDLYSSAGVEAGDVFRRVVVDKREDLSDTIVRFTVKAVDGSALPAGRAGQYTSVGVTLPDGARQLRQYWLVASEEGKLSFVVKRVLAEDDAPAGEVSNWLGDNAQVGTELDATIPFGDLVVDIDGTDPVVLLSAGIGTTPMMGILAALHAHASSREVVVVHCESSEEADVFAPERRALVDDLKDARLESVYSAGAQRMSIDELDLPRNAQVFVCGGTGFLEDARAQLREVGFSDDTVHFELFAPNDWLLDG